MRRIRSHLTVETDIGCIFAVKVAMVIEGFQVEPDMGRVGIHAVGFRIVAVAIVHC